MRPPPWWKIHQYKRSRHTSPWGAELIRREASHARARQLEPGAWFSIASLVSIAFGLVLVGRPDVGAISLAVIYRIFSVAFGIMPTVILLEIGTAESRACGRSYSS